MLKASNKVNEVVLASLLSYLFLVFRLLSFYLLNLLLGKEDQPIIAWYCFSIPPENIREPKGFPMFSGDIEKQYRAVMG